MASKTCPATLAAIFLLAFQSSAHAAPAGDEKERARLREDAIDLCQRSVTENLKAPATAKFAPRREMKGIDRRDGGFNVTGYVDSQNGFGALVRSEYLCAIKITKEGLEVVDQKVATRR
jgi:hypothetical protein